MPRIWRYDVGLFSLGPDFRLVLVLNNNEEIYPIALGKPPFYSLGELRGALHEGGPWNSPGVLPKGAVMSVAAKGMLFEGSRSVQVFDTCRFVAYAVRDNETET
ncbi:hypothetical protein ACHABQ_05480 [Nesterenkonia aurantiaca]|uniref:hypothetical protein n=1 Tax=Nesterenkonia aurantiaca TaxID=1436010 RepID=UPI003EE6A31D